MTKHKSHSKFGKFLLSAIGALILLFIISIIMLTTLLNPNNFKTQISSLIQKNTGRNFTINGDVKWSFFPSLGLKLNQISMGNAPGFSPQTFAQIEAADVDVKLLPLFAGKVEIGKIKLNNLTLNLSKNAQGKNNWSDISSASKNSAAKQPQETTTQTTAKNTKLPILTISTIDVNNATITWNDQQAKQQATVDHLNLSSDHVNFGKPFPIKLAMHVVSNQPAINIQLNLAAQTTLNPQTQQYALKTVSLNGNLLDKKYPSGKLPFYFNSNITADLKQQTLQINNLNLQVANLTAKGNLSGSKISQDPVFESNLNIPNFNLRNFLTSIGQKPQLQDATAMQNASLQAHSEFSAKFVKLSNITAKLDDSALEGQFTFANFDNKAFNFDLNINQINLNRYLSSTTNNNSTNSKGNTTPSSSTVAAATPSATTANSNTLPVKFLRELSGTGSAKIGTLTASNITATNIDATLTAKAGVIKVAPINATLYQGKSHGGIMLNVQGATPSIIANEILTGVQVGDLLNAVSKNSKIQITGTGNLDVSLQAQGQNTNAMTRNLDGNIKFAVNNGVIKNLDVGQQIYAAIARVFKKDESNQPTNQTNFSSLTGTVTITNGIASNNDLLLKSQALQVNGQGTADLVNQTINYMLKAVALGGTFGRDVLTLQNQIGGNVPIKVSGSFSNPSIQPDYENIATEALKSQFQRQIENRFGSAASNPEIQKNVGKAIDAVKGFLGN